jgi:uncharacterized membrane protein
MEVILTDPAALPKASPIPDINDLGLSDISASLRAGWSDFCAAPLFGIFFSSVYVIGGWVMYFIYYEAGEIWWGIPFVVGFPLIAPFAAVGLYEVSRRMEQNIKPEWGSVLGLVFAERNRQVPWVGALIMFWFMFWVFIAHTIFAIVMGLSAMENAPDVSDLFVTKQGLTLLALEMGLGAFFAFVVYVVTAISLPLLLDREIDFVTAMIVSTQAVFQNFVPMLIWAFIIATMMFFGMVLGFLGLLVVLPVLGHATWHIYRRILSQ